VISRRLDAGAANRAADIRVRLRSRTRVRDSRTAVLIPCTEEFRANTAARWKACATPARPWARSCEPPVCCAHVDSEQGATCPSTRSRTCRLCSKIGQLARVFDHDQPAARASSRVRSARVSGDGDGIVLVALERRRCPGDPQWYRIIVADEKDVEIDGDDRAMPAARVCVARERARLWPPRGRAVHRATQEAKRYRPRVSVVVCTWNY